MRTTTKKVYIRLFMRIRSLYMSREKTNLTIHPAVKKNAKTLAELDGRSLSELVERLLEEFIQKHRQKGSAEMEEGKKKMRGGGNQEG